MFTPWRHRQPQEDGLKAHSRDRRGCALAPVMSPSASSPSDLEAQNEQLTRFRRHVTIEERELAPQASRHGAEMVPRLTGEFRTLSIHVETRTSPIDADTGATRKAAVKGAYSPPLSP